MKVLFVCLGNICRSPLAEAIFNHKVKQQKLEGTLEADSCGTAAYHVGDSPDVRSLDVANRHGVAVDHVGRQFSPRDYQSFDLILAMDEANQADLLRFSHNAAEAKKVKLIRKYDPEGPGAVPDPYYGNENGFEVVFGMLDRTIEQLIKEITNP